MAVGTDVPNTATGSNVSLMLTGSGTTGWRTVDTPQPGGANGNSILGGIADIGPTSWAVGMFDTGGGHMPLLQHN